MFGELGIITRTLCLDDLRAAHSCNYLNTWVNKFSNVFTPHTCLVFFFFYFKRTSCTKYHELRRHQQNKERIQGGLKGVRHNNCKMTEASGEW